MTTSHASLPRFFTCDLANGRMVMTGMDALQILNHVRDQLWPSVDADTVEIFDCGPGGVDAEAVSLSAEEARTRFRTVYRGVDVPGLPPIALSTRA